MNKTFCDKCDTEITEANGLPNVLEVKVRGLRGTKFSIRPRELLNTHDVCAGCVRDVLAPFDKREMAG